MGKSKEFCKIYIDQSSHFVYNECGDDNMKIKRKAQFHIGQIIECRKQSVKIIDIELQDVVTQSGVRYNYHYKVECLTCGQIVVVSESSLKSGSGCQVCSNLKIVKGINDMWTTAPHIAKLLRYKTDGYKYAKSCRHALEFTCPICGYHRWSKVNDVYNKGLRCPKYGTGTSYCEKLMLNVLDFLEIEYIFQYRPTWAKNKRYDFYLPNCNTIVEIHGEQHYQKTHYFHVNSSYKNFEMEQENDKLKRKLAIDNHIVKYIVLDCRISTIDHFKDVISKNKDLQEIIDLDKIDWRYCEKHSLSRKIYEPCILYNQGYAVDVIAQKLNLSIQKIEKCLSKGSDFDLCNFVGKKQIIHNLEKDIIFTSQTELAKKSQEIFGSYIPQNYLSKKFKKSDCIILRGFTFRLITNKEARMICQTSA